MQEEMYDKKKVTKSDAMATLIYLWSKSRNGTKRKCAQELTAIIRGDLPHA